MEAITMFAPAIVLLALAGLAFAGLRKVPRLGLGWKGAKAGDQRQLRTIERLALSQVHSLHLIQAGDRELLIGTHSTGFTLLDAGPRSTAPVAARAPEPADSGTRVRLEESLARRFALRGTR